MLDLFESNDVFLFQDFHCEIGLCFLVSAKSDSSKSTGSYFCCWCCCCLLNVCVNRSFVKKRKGFASFVFFFFLFLLLFVCFPFDEHIPRVSRSSKSSSFQSSVLIPPTVERIGVKSGTVLSKLLLFERREEEEEEGSVAALIEFMETSDMEASTSIAMEEELCKVCEEEEEEEEAVESKLVGSSEEGVEESDKGFMMLVSLFEMIVVEVGMACC